MMSIKKISFFSLLIIILVYTCFPFYWAVVSALKKTGTGNFTVEYWPKQPTLENFFYVLSRPAFGSTFFNSVFVYINSSFLLSNCLNSRLCSWKNKI